MLSSIQKDRRIRASFFKNERLVRLNKFLFIYLSAKFRTHPATGIDLGIQKLLFKIKSYSKTRIRARCRLTGRGNGVYRPYYLSRFVLRELIQFGALPGYKKAVW